MDCNAIKFSDHAIGQMFRRDISVENIKNILTDSEIINRYSNDKPYPSYLLLGFIFDRPLHVVIGKDDMTGNCVIITAYEPLSNLWESDFKTKKG